MGSVYFSELLSQKHPAAWKRIIQAIGQSDQIEIQLLKSTKDIWCRDYMPVKSTSGKLIQFRYEPSYLRNYNHLQSDPKQVLKTNKIEATFSNINLDGGNVILYGKKAIITDRVWLENPEYDNPHRLYMDLEELLEAELIIMPSHLPKIDMTGHIDGMMRFADANTLIGNDLSLEKKSIAKKVETVLQDHGLEYVNLPFYEDKSAHISAIGIYINYLELIDVIIFPIFERNEVDNKALSIITKTFPNKEIIAVNINEIARAGGLLNCISWTKF